MAKKSNISVIMIGPRPPTRGGISTFVSTLEKYLRDKENFEIIPITQYVFHQTELSFGDVLSISFIKNFITKMVVIFTNVIIIAKVARGGRKEKKLIAHIHTAGGFSAWENSIYILLLSVFKIPTILHMHLTERGYSCFRNSIKKKILKRILEKSDVIVVLSKYWKDMFNNDLQIPERKLMIIHNGVDINKFKHYNYRSSRKKLRLSHNKKVIFSLGNLIERKGFRYLIEAINEVRRYRDDFICFIGGEGPEREKLQKIINDLDLQDFAKLIGYIPDELLPIWMNACDIFVLPSLGEGSPLVMFEALACGKPFIGTKVGAIPEIIISKDYGLLCPATDHECLAEKILIALEKEWDREKIRKYAEQFTWDRIAEKTLRLYQSILKRREISNVN